MLSMRAIRFTIPALILLSLFVGSALATTAKIEMRFDSPSQITGVIDATGTGEDAQELRGQIDQSGDGNQQVTTAEVNDFETQVMTLFKQFAQDDDNGSSSTGGDFTIDGKGPNKFEFTAFDVQKAEGPVSSTAPVDIRMELRLTFPATGGDTHIVRLKIEGQDEDDAGGAFDFELTSARITAPPAHRFEKVTGLPSGATYSDEAVDFGQAYKTPAIVEITMAKWSGNAATLGPAFAAAVLVGVAVLRRGRA